MNNDLISREALLDVMCKTCPIQGMCDYVPCRMWDHIQEAPAVDAEPVRHGRWIDRSMDVVCSACNTAFKDAIDFIQGADGDRPKYCPERGARMDGGERG